MEMSIDLMYVRKVDLMNLLISGSVCVGFKSSKSVIFLSQTGVLCFTYSSSIVFIKIFLAFAVRGQSMMMCLIVWLRYRCNKVIGRGIICLNDFFSLVWPERSQRCFDSNDL